MPNKVEADSGYLSDGSVGEIKQDVKKLERYPLSWSLVGFKRGNFVKSANFPCFANLSKHHLS